jgi:hypothetical protein
MRSSTRFTKSCPTCGRHLDIPIEQMGRRVMCSHCHAEFLATTHVNIASERVENNLDERIDRLLAETSSAPPRPHFDHYAVVSSRTYEV